MRRPATRIPVPAQPEVSSNSTANISGGLQAFIQEQQRKGRLNHNERVALVAYDLTADRYITTLNAGTPFQAASMVKPFVALAFFHEVQAGRLHYTGKHRNMMERMIQHSDNNATNWFMRQLGGPARCNAIISRYYGRLFRQVRIREYIPAGGKTYRNTIAPQDYIQYLKELWARQLPASAEILRVMGLPGRDRIYCGTRIPGGVQVYDKTGTTSLLCGDMGILVTRSRTGAQIPYAVVGIVQRRSIARNYRLWMATGGNVIRDFSSLVYEEMKQKYNLL